MRIEYNENEDLLSIYEGRTLIEQFDSPRDGDNYSLDFAHEIMIEEEMTVALYEYGEFKEYLKVKMI